MNPIFNAAADALTQGTLLGLTTACFLVFFTVVFAWAYAPGNRDMFERHGRIPLDDTDPGRV